MPEETNDGEPAWCFDCLAGRHGEADERGQSGRGGGGATRLRGKLFAYELSC
jgi:hypothetical protein